MWIECVPNVSEGRRAEVIDTCASAIRGTGARLLDVSSDPDHHRTVYTFAGDRDTVSTGALALVECALTLINLHAHAGVHPRLGAVDVLPFAPLGDTPMGACVAVAHTVAAEVARRFHLPVFLYEQAARAPDEGRLEHIRGAGFESLAARLAEGSLVPDFGPATPHPTAGGIAIGAREVLVAYNVNLDTDRLEVAKRIARAVRERDGGLPFVKALGLPLARLNRVQVSMNLTRVRVTSIQTAFAAVAHHAALEGVAVLESEIVGLVPASALSPAVAEEIKLRDGDRDRVIEKRLEGPGGLGA